MPASPFLATEQLAWALVSRASFPSFAEEELAAARNNLARRFQEAWIDEATKLRYPPERCRLPAAS